MEVILLEDIKGKGKKNQVINVNNGYGNFLISNKKGVLANEVNLENLSHEKEEIKKQEAAILEEAKKLKEVIDTTIVTVKVKSGEKGQIFGSVSTKQIVDILFNEKNIKLDKKKVHADVTMNSLGVYKLSVALHKDVKATLTVQVKDINVK